MKTRAHLLIEGRVQGVFFRSETRYRAREHNVKGWIRNLANGNVEAVFEGEETAVKELVGFCRHGPRGARVTQVDVTWKKYVGHFHDFEVRYGF